MGPIVERRSLLGAGAGAALLALLPGCQSLGGAFSLTEAVRRLLTRSSQNAFASLLEPDGFYDSEIARLPIPDELGGQGGLVGTILRSDLARRQLLEALNGAAEEGARLAAPVVADMVRGMSIEDAAALVSGGSTAATDYLRAKMAGGLVEAMLPGIGDGLRLAQSGIVGRLLEAATGIDFERLRRAVSREAADAIYRAIGAEEAAIRADPARTDDPLLIAVFGTARALDR